MKEQSFYGHSPEDLERLDKELIWHPFTQMSDWLVEEPLIVASGEGSYLTDVHGKRYLDGVSSLWVNVHGHRQPEIDRAITEQLSNISHSTFLGLSNVPAIELARRLVELAPRRLSRVFYSDNGSTAVEVALKMAFQYWPQSSAPSSQRTGFISFANAYHGDTVGSVSLGGIALFHKTYKPLLFQTVRAPSAYCYRCYMGKEYPSCDMACLGDVEEAMEKNRDRIAAVVMEPLVQGAAGMVVFPPGYTKRVWELAKKYGMLFIADEVATGFGRTGAMFACHLEGIEPDFMCVAKGITGGYLPLAATLASSKVFDGFLAEYKERKTFFHGHTYTANPLACAAAIASLALFQKDDVLEKLQGKIAGLSEGLKAFRKLRHVGDVRQLGFMVGIELMKDPEKKKDYAYEDKIGIRVIREARKRGLVIRPLDNVIVLMPPLSISQEELDRALEITYESIKVVTEEGRK